MSTNNQVTSICDSCRKPFRRRRGARPSELLCGDCREARRKKAAEQLGTRPVSPEELQGPYLLRGRPGATVETDDAPSGLQAMLVASAKQADAAANQAIFEEQGWRGSVMVALNLQAQQIEALRQRVAALEDRNA